MLYKIAVATNEYINAIKEMYKNNPNLKNISIKQFIRKNNLSANESEGLVNTPYLMTHYKKIGLNKPTAFVGKDAVKIVYGKKPEILNKPYKNLSRKEKMLINAFIKDHESNEMKSNNDVHGVKSGIMSSNKKLFHDNIDVLLREHNVLTSGTDKNMRKLRKIAIKTRDIHNEIKHLEEYMHQLGYKNFKYGYSDKINRHALKNLRYIDAGIKKFVPKSKFSLQGSKEFIDYSDRKKIYNKEKKKELQNLAEVNNILYT